MSSIPVLLLILLIQFPTALAAPAAAPQPQPSTLTAPPGDVSGDTVSAQLKDSVVQAEKSLGTLTPQQKKIFDEEVVPDYRLFIRDYGRDGQIGGDIHAQVDLDGIRSIIRFAAPAGSKILLYLNVDPHCVKCVAEAPPIRKIMEAGVERRGFAPVWVSPQELASASLADLVGPRGAMGFLQMDMVPAPIDDEDAAHESRYFAKAQLSIHGIASYQDQAELYDTDSFQLEGEKLLTHSFTDLGSKADLVGISSFAKDDLLIEVQKIGDFEQYRELRDALRAGVKGVALVEQRRLSRGQAVFALKTHKSMDEIKGLLKGLQLDDTHQALLTGSKDQSILMEIR